MEIDQIVKQVNWLDEERRKDKLKVGSIEESIQAMEGKFPAIEKQQKELESQITRLNAIVAKIDVFDEAVLQARIEFKQQIDDLEKQNKRREEEVEKARRLENRSLQTGIADVRKEIDQLPEIKRNLKTRVEEEIRLGRNIDELRNRLDMLHHSEEEYIRSIRVLEDGRRQDTKKLTDLTGEVTATRKRLDDQSGKLELSTSAFKKIETRVNELTAVETERRETISNFLDTQALRDVERERLWKEWQTRFDQVESQASEIESSLQALDATQRAVKRSQQIADELSQKVERRINEIAEMQRLTEERFRQEWSTFKADDQKRWTNYILTMEEQRNDAQRQHEKLSEKVTQIEDGIQEIQDLIQQMNEHTEKRLQSMLTITHEWVSSYERTVGRNR